LFSGITEVLGDILTRSFYSIVTEKNSDKTLKELEALKICSMYLIFFLIIERSVSTPIMTTNSLTPYTYLLNTCKRLFLSYAVIVPDLFDFAHTLYFVMTFIADM